MTNINLHQTAEEQEEKSSFLDSGMFISLLLLVVVLLLYGGLRSYNQYSFVQQIEDKKVQTMTINDSMSGSDVDRINDFNLRLDTMSEDVETPYVAEHMMNVASVVVEGVRLDGVTYDRIENLVSIEGTADTMNMLAKQLFHLKASSAFGEVSVSELSIDEEGKLVFQINALAMNK